MRYAEQAMQGVQAKLEALRKAQKHRSSSAGMLSMLLHLDCSGLF